MQILFLVDYENVGPDGLKGIDSLSQNDEVTVFYSFKSTNLTWDLHEKINRSKAKFILKKVHVGHKDALDFQLSSYAGYLLSKLKENDEVVIISNDKGYDNVIRFWKDEINCTKIMKFPSIHEFLMQLSCEDQADSTLEKILISAKVNMSQNEVNNLKTLIKNNEKDKVHNALQSKCGFKKANYVYDKIKKYIF